MITWTRAELKSRAKAAVKMYYWKLVLVSLILSAITGGATSAGRNGVKNSGTTGNGSAVDVSGIFSGINPMALMVASVAVLVLVVIAIAIRVFVLNVLVVGCKGFFSQSMTGEPEFRVLGDGFTRNYRNCVKTCFLRDLFVGLWSLLFVIPGVIKSYEYRMVPYLLAEHPEMGSSEVLARSKEMMAGNKWETFVLDLSFIGWVLLGAITMGIVYIFWTSPYINTTDAALYHRLSGQDSYGNGGYAQTGYTQSGYGRTNYDQAGYDQGSYGQNSYDQNGYNQSSYNRSGYDQTGYSRSGNSQTGYEQHTEAGTNGQDAADSSSNSGYDQNYFLDK